MDNEMIALLQKHGIDPQLLMCYLRQKRDEDREILLLCPDAYHSAEWFEAHSRITNAGLFLDQLRSAV